MRILTISMCLVAMVSPAMAATVYQVELVSSRPSSIVSIASARSGSDRFGPLRFARGPLRYGSESVLFELRGGDDCLRDLRIEFADGHWLTRHGFDFCSAHRDDTLRDDRRTRLD